MRTRSHGLGCRRSSMPPGGPPDAEMSAFVITTLPENTGRRRIRSCRWSGAEDIASDALPQPGPRVLLARGCTYSPAREATARICWSHSKITERLLRGIARATGAVMSGVLPLLPSVRPIPNRSGRPEGPIVSRETARAAPRALATNSGRPRRSACGSRGRLQPGTGGAEQWSTSSWVGQSPRVRLGSSWRQRGVSRVQQSLRQPRKASQARPPSRTSH